MYFFRWTSQEEVDNFDVLGIDADGEKTYILEVDLHYPDQLHDKHNDYPLAGMTICSYYIIVYYKVSLYFIAHFIVHFILYTL